MKTSLSCLSSSTSSFCKTNEVGGLRNIEIDQQSVRRSGLHCIESLFLVLTSFTSSVPSPCAMKPISISSGRSLSSRKLVITTSRQRCYSISSVSYNDQASQQPSSSSSNHSSVSSSQQASQPKQPKAGSPKTKTLSSTPPIRFSPRGLSTFPSLVGRTSPLYDSGIVVQSPTSPALPYASSFTLINESTNRLFKPTPPSAESLIASSGGSTSAGTSGSDRKDAEYLSSVTSLSAREINELHKHAISVRRVQQMTGKGKMTSYSALVIVGNGKGLVGYGQAKDASGVKAGRKAFHQGVKSMDYVERYENRTVETVIEGKWRATKVILRPRPAGFGLRVPPSIHAVARSAGLSDLSASIRGSTTPDSVVKATLQALWPGSAPIGLGDGLGGKGRRADKGTGPRSRLEIMRERGRRLEEVNLI